MNLEQFFSQHSSTFSRAFNSRFCNQYLREEVRELARLGLKLFPVSLAAKLAGDPDRLIAAATDDLTTLQELSEAIAGQPLWGYRLALGPSGLCVLILDGAVGRGSFAALVPDLDDCLTLQARRGDRVYVFFRQPRGMKRIAGARKLAPGVSILGHDAGFDLPPAGGADWLNPGAEIDALPYVLRELLASDTPDSPQGRAVPASKPCPRPAPRRSTVHFPRPDRAAPRRKHPDYRQRGGYRISSRR